MRPFVFKLELNPRNGFQGGIVTGMSEMALVQEAAHRSQFRPGHHARRQRRAEFRPREMRLLRRLLMELRLRLVGQLRAHGRRLPCRHGRIPLGGELKLLKLKSLDANL